jgi:hypothetical protein
MVCGYEILYARTAWDKIKEVKFSQLFPCVFSRIFDLAFLFQISKTSLYLKSILQYENLLILNCPQIDKMFLNRS